MMRRTGLGAVVLVFCAVASGATARANSLQTYLALGDSLAFGETDFTHNPSAGDRGYVGLYADALAKANGGVRPAVINLGVDAETTTTFFHGGPPGNGTLSGQPAPQLNLNYPNPAPTQNALMLSTINAQELAGHTISTVTVQLGANDLFTVVNQPNFFSLTPGQQQAAVAQALTTVGANDTVLLSELRGLLPHTNILMMGYYNPFNADPTSPMGQIADPAIKALNGVIAQEAVAFGAHYVDLYNPLKGHELADTFIANGNVHPNAAGYALIATQVEAVPEPSTLFLVAAGAAVLWLWRSWRGA
jgi:lysophospholipase L1-like esterase